MQNATPTSARPPAELFRNRSFLRLWLAQLISTIGDWALMIAVPVTVFNATGSKTALSLTFLSGTVSAVFFSMIGGVLADRWNRRRTMIAVDLGRALAVLLLLLIPDARHLSAAGLGLFYGVAFLTSSLSCFFSPARQALMASLLPGDSLTRANSLTLSSLQIATLIGPTLGGLLLAWLHPHGAFLFDAATFVASAALVAGVADVPFTPGRKSARGVAGVWQDAGDGLRFVWANRRLRAVLCLLVIVVTGGFIYNALEFAFVRDVLHGSPRQFGYLLSAGGLGAVAGGLLPLAKRGGSSPSGLMVLGFAVLVAAGLGYAFAPSLVLAGAALFVLGMGNTFVNVGLLTLFMTDAPDEMRGRVTAVNQLANRTAMSLGAGGAALLSASVPLRSLFAGVAGVFLLCMLLTRPFLEPPVATTEGGAAPAPNADAAA